MSWRRLVAAVAAGVVAVPVAATAAPGAPAPTVSVSTYLPTGTEVPADTVSAAWTHVRRGCAGLLQVSGSSVSAATTVVSAGFVSRPFRLRGPIAAVEYVTNHNALVDALPERVRLQLRLRTVPGAWSDWYTVGVDANPPQPVVVDYTEGGGVVVSAPVGSDGSPPTMQVQLRLSEQVTSTGTVDDKFATVFGC
jgi:hypothetical protein